MFVVGVIGPANVIHNVGFHVFSFFFILQSFYHSF